MREEIIKEITKILIKPLLIAIGLFASIQVIIYTFHSLERTTVRMSGTSLVLLVLIAILISAFLTSMITTYKNSYMLRQGAELATMGDRFNTALVTSMGKVFLAGSKQTNNQQSDDIDFSNFSIEAEPIKYLGSGEDNNEAGVF